MAAPKILLVDDSPVNQMLCSKIFSQLGYRFKGVKLGGKAAKILKSEEFDLMILDLELPDSYGLDIAGLLREIEKKGTHKTSIIAIAGRNDYPGEELTKADILDYLIKPLDYDNLVGLVQQRLS